MPKRVMRVDLCNATAVPLTFQGILPSTDVSEGLGHQWIQRCVLSSEKKNINTKERTSQISNQPLVDHLGVAGKFRHFAWSHGDEHSLPHSQFKLLAQNQLHRFAVGSHGPGVIQHFAITMTSAVVEHHLTKHRMSNKGKLLPIKN